MSGTSTDSTAFNALKDCVAYKVIQAWSKPISHKSSKDTATSDTSSTEDELASELEEFILFLAQEAYGSIPEHLKAEETFSTANTDSNSNNNNDSREETESNDVEARLKSELVAIPAPVSFCETLVAYSLSNDMETSSDIFHSILSSYHNEMTSIAEETAKASRPPAQGWKSTRVPCCQICDRNVPLTYHHLIPKSTHTKVLKRKWHPEEMLNSVAWLCRQCHSAVHRSAPNEDLARSYYTVELLMQQEYIQKWAAYASRQRWGQRPAKAIKVVV